MFVCFCTVFNILYRLMQIWRRLVEVYFYFVDVKHVFNCIILIPPPVRGWIRSSWQNPAVERNSEVTVQRNKGSSYSDIITFPPSSQARADSWASIGAMGYNEACLHTEGSPRFNLVHVSVLAGHMTAEIIAVRSKNMQLWKESEPNLYFGPGYFGLTL